MNLFARILSHGFALLVVALLAIGLIYRGDLFPGLELPDFLVFERSSDAEVAADDTAAMPDSQEEEGTAPQETVAAEVGDGERADIQVDVAEAVSAEQQEMATTAGETAGMQQPVTGLGEDAGQDPQVALPDAETGIAVTPPEASAAPEDEPVQTDMGQAGAETQELPSSPPAPVVQELPQAASGEAQPLQPQAVVPVPEPGAVTVAEVAESDETSDVADMQADSPVAPVEDEMPVAVASVQAPPVETTRVEATYRLLAAAREAYWLRDYATAEQKYQDMIDLNPANPDGYGELGNMYFSQGKWDMASSAYFEAGKRLADEGLYEEARQLVDVLKGLQGSQAGELEQYIDGRTQDSGTQ